MRTETLKRHLILAMPWSVIALMVMTLGLAPFPLGANPNDHEHHHHHAMPGEQDGYVRSLATYTVPDVKLLDPNRAQVSLRRQLDDKPVIMNFIFTSCGAICPVMSTTFSEVQKALGPERNAVRMVSISIDPEHDTPEVMRAYGGKHVKGGSPVPWHFLTAASKRELAPMLDGFGQDVSKAAKGQADKELVHVLKLFLIDKEGWVREIYSTSYLIPQVVVNDIKTLLIEDGVKVN